MNITRVVFSDDIHKKIKFIEVFASKAGQEKFKGRVADNHVTYIDNLLMNIAFEMQLIEGRLDTLISLLNSNEHPLCYLPSDLIPFFPLWCMEGEDE